MKRLVFIFLLCFAGSFPAMAKEIILGEQLSLKEMTKISEINASPEKYLGKRVQVKGLIVDVCGHRGCWMDLAGDVPFEKIKVKVVDGEIVFPLEAKGRTAIVEGTVEMLQLNEQQAIQYGMYMAYERGEKFDPSTVKGPMRIYRVRGLGARIL